MDTNIARQTGGKKALKAQIFTILLLEFFYMLASTSGDFANNIIFFIDAQMNKDVLGFFILLLGGTYFLGRRAGVEMLIRSRHDVITGIKYALISSVVMLGYLFIDYCIHNGPAGVWKVISVPMVYITAAIVVAWLWTTRELSKKKA
ncbi:hypothetical protein [Chitinophaga sp.]|uniref:hypothetical protein n=1 Tax=Chitinophaga sp. TaxID=1869181 RepID=UPI002F92DEAD